MLGRDRASRDEVTVSAGRPTLLMLLQCVVRGHVLEQGSVTGRSGWLHQRRVLRRLFRLLQAEARRQLETDLTRDVGRFTASTWSVEGLETPVYRSLRIGF